LGWVRIDDLIILRLELLDGPACPVGQRYPMPLDLAQRVVAPTLAIMADVVPITVRN
jgi:hypothetical protein